MKRLLLIFLFLMFMAVPASAGWVKDQHGNIYWVDDVKPNAYGHGVNMDTYGRSHQYRNQQGQSDSNWDVQRDAYGPGVHMNQYGQPVHDDNHW